jgi:uncharacterized protein
MRSARGHGWFMAPDDGSVRLEVVYALPDQQALVSICVASGTSAQAAAEASGLAQRFGLNTQEWALGLWGQAFGTGGLPAATAYRVEPGDRVEIYRPLQCDPKEVRRRRAERAARTRQG